LITFTIETKGFVLAIITRKENLHPFKFLLTKFALVLIVEPINCKVLFNLVWVLASAWEEVLIRGKVTLIQFRLSVV